MASRIVPIPSLTAIRGLFAIWVVLFHYKREFDSIPARLILDQGYLAVDMFFVLSGFILSHVYADALLEKRTTASDFFIRRVARIYPLHLISLLAVTALYLVGHHYGFIDDAGEDLKEFWSHLALAHAWGASEDVALNVPSWSISAEFIAYTLFIIPVWLISKSGPRRALLSSIFLFMATWLFVKVCGAELLGSSTMFSLPLQYSFLRIVPEFFLGMCFYRYAAEKMQPVHPIYLALCVLVMTIAVVLQVHVVFVFLGGALYALLFLNNPNVPRWFHFLGVVSFSLYMIHWPFQLVAFELGELMLGWTYHQAPALWLPIFMVATIAVATATFYLVEQPANRLCLRMFYAMSRIRTWRFW
ncbi:MAG: acyltransferase [Salinisphaera sp.]|uniref:acyltransferase family protein n=1 Tax=Salinisphaera sp. TaxID=1914330 RepID=UPI003C79AA89